MEIDKELEENNFILKKEGFFKTFVVLILRYRKIEKTNSFNRWWRFNEINIYS